MANFSNWYVQTNRNLGKIAQHSLGLLTDLHAGSVVECKLPGRIPGRGALFALFGEGKSELVVGNHSSFIGPEKPAVVNSIFFRVL